MFTELLAELKTPIEADIIALDREDNIILLVEVKIVLAQEEKAKQRIVDYMIAWLKTALSRLSEKGTNIPFVMYVDLDKINVFKWDGVNLSEPLCTLKTAEILSFYDPNFLNKKWLSEDYLETLTEAWLQDLNTQWKHDKPPALEQIDSIGLRQYLINCSTKTEVNIGGSFVYRD
ncbi:MAG: hypothetical protein ACRCT1_20095 [Microcoleaceae cyanobacterium]|jgi:hypothetical protein